MSRESEVLPAGSWGYAPGCRVLSWIPAPAVEVAPVVEVAPAVEDEPAYTIVDSVSVNLDAPSSINPSNRGVKCRVVDNNPSSFVNPDRDAIKVAGSGWVAPAAPGFHSAACDWLTLTATEDAGMKQLFEVAVLLGDDLRAAGDDMREKKELQYSGYAVGRHLFYGESSRQGGYLRVSGSVAPAALDRVRAMQKRYFHATRYDAQLTALFPELPDADFFRSMAIGSQEYGRQAGRRGRPWSCEVRETLGRGDTTYVGDKATAEVYGRSYDKHKEAASLGVEYPAGAVRFEVSHRREMANMFLADAVKADDLGEFHAGYVCGWFSARGVEVGLDAATVAQLRGPGHRTDTERRRQWFRSQVRRGAQLNAHFVGLEETLKDLGLWDEVCRQYIEGK